MTLVPKYANSAASLYDMDPISFADWTILGSAEKIPSTSVQIVSMETPHKFATIAAEWSEPFRFKVDGKPAAEVARKPVMIRTVISELMIGACERFQSTRTSFPDSGERNKKSLAFTHVQVIPDPRTKAERI
jgi:hypothetical protein